MHNAYKTRTGGATVTVFVPYNCKNNCPFCINKQEYEDMSAFSLEKILRSIQIMDEITPNCDFVITGGEPMANTDALQRIIDTIPPTHRLFINTSFPVFENISACEALAFTEKNKNKITCMNISRHILKYVEETPDELLGRIACPTRINCVLYGKYSEYSLAPFVERFLPYKMPIQFRYDYTATTPDTLYEEKNDMILQELKRQFTYKGLDGCRMRNGFHFEYKGLHLTYHKTLPYSTITEKGDDGVTYDILYDIVIKQNGDIHSDWTGVMLDVNGYRNVTFEPYDMRVIEGTVDF